MRSTLESALVTAANHALEETSREDRLGQQTLTYVLNHCFPSLAQHERARLNYDILLPYLIHSAFNSEDGLNSGYFLGSLDLDMQPVSGGQLGWSERSASFQRVQRMLSDPLLSSLGPLCRLIGRSIESSLQQLLIVNALEELETFSRTLHMQWRQNKLSEVDASEYGIYLYAEARDRTTPQLWKLLKSTLFGILIILRSIVGRTLNDPILANTNSTRIQTSRNYLIC